MTKNESDSSREWASQAQALLKQKQEQQKLEEEIRMNYEEPPHIMQG